ncbi:hypothetical protein BKA63DRAFT_491720 [Paraphoma chrysanthemicola]|nr:hypothetical protein BKA63DRAFT_491720 [Paraphoma chrysanthemicola]
MDLAQYLEQCAREDRAGIDDYIASRAAAESVPDDQSLDDFLSGNSHSMPPQAFNISTRLIQGCTARKCTKTSNLSRCAACKVVYYCGREHQTSDRPSHRSFCSKIKKAQAGFEQEEKALRREEGDIIFEEGRGHFWGLLETRDYMRARYTLVEALLKVNTVQAVTVALEHLLEMLQLCRSDNMGVRDVVPGLYLRLERDQDAYGFCKWWAEVGEDANYDFGDTDLPYLDTKDADAFEDVKLFTGRYSSLSFVVNITLIKIRLLADLQSLQRAKELAGPHVPREILDHIQQHTVGSIVANSPNIIKREDQRPHIAELRDQIQQLFYAVQGANPHFWPALLQPGENLRARPTSYSHGSKAQMQLILQYTYNAWSETPGAIGIMETLWNQYEDAAL